MRLFVFIAVFVIGTALAEISLDELPMPNIDELAVIKERCDTKGGEGTYEKVKEAKNKIQTCLTGMFNATQIKIELDEAAKTGSMDEVFGKYCRKRPEVKTCVNDFIDAIKPCLEDNEKDALNLTLNIMEQLGEFACYRDGDRMAMFVAEGGIECLKDHTDGIQNCVNSTFTVDTSDLPTDSNSISSLLINKERCNDLGRLQTCVVEELEKCEESTPANVIDALFKFVKKQACKDSTQRKRSIFKRSSITDAVQSEDNKQKFLEFMRNRCKKYGTPNSYDSVSTSFDEALSCLRRLRAGTLSADDIKEKIQNCLRPFLKNMKVCLPEEEEYITDFYSETASNVVEYMLQYKNKMQTQEFTMEMINCFQNFKQNTEHFKELQECVQKGEDDGDNDLDTIVTKQRLCKKLTKVDACVNDAFANVCVRDIEIQSFVDGFLDSITKFCADKVDEE